MTLIAAVDQNWGIGIRGAPLFRIPADLRRFRAVTMGHALLMGRKTFDSLPGLLPGRAHVVLSRDPDFSPPGVIVLRNLDQAREFAREHETFLIGGEEIYAALLDSCARALVTKIDAAREADAALPNLDALPHWAPVREGPWRESGGLRFRFCEYARHGGAA